jgi:hypothetical protein
LEGLHLRSCSGWDTKSSIGKVHYFALRVVKAASKNCALRSLVKTQIVYKLDYKSQEATSWLKARTGAAVMQV